MRNHDLIEVTLPNGEALRGDVLSEDAPGDFAVVFAHGFGSVRRGEKALALEAECARRNWTFAAFDFRGHGESGGTMRDLRGSRLIEDLAAVRGYLAAVGVKRLGLVGSSMGGWASAWFALEQPEAVAGCVFLAPGFRFLHRRWDMLTEEERVQWYQQGSMRFRNEHIDVEVGFGLVEEKDKFPHGKLEAGWATPTLIFHGLADDVVPVADSIAFIENVKCPDVELRLLKSGDHRLSALKAEMAVAACDFFAARGFK